MSAHVFGHATWINRESAASRVIAPSAHAGWDAWLVALAMAHGAALLAWPSVALIAVGLWWNANTISHLFIHRPFFRRRAFNALFSCFLSLLLGFPQSFWGARHLAHHGAVEGGKRSLLSPDLAAVIALWGGLLLLAPGFTLSVYLPGFLAGLGLCWLQGHYEHASGTVSHYGWLYNVLLFNDGYHIEHHARPGAHWRELPRERRRESRASRWPAVLRWIECLNLCLLERLVLRFATLQRFVLDRHERALRRLLAGVPEARRIGIVGGGLFPRTAIILGRLRPQSPLAFEGDRQTIYRCPPADALLVHDWIWRRRGTSVVVSWLLLKRLNLVMR